MNKPLGITAIVVAVLGAVFMYGRIQRAIGAEDVRATIAGKVADEKKMTLDSVRRANDANDKATQRAADSVKRVADAKLAKVRAASDTAIANARAVAAQAADVLADTAATIEVVRHSLRDALTANVSLANTLATERAAATVTLKQRDSTHAEQLATLRSNHTTERAAEADAWKAQLKSAELQVRASYRKGVSTGRAQALGGLGVAAVVTLFALR